MTLQEMLDKIVEGLRAQGRRSVYDGACRYRVETEGGVLLKCAVGMLIPDDCYNRQLMESEPSDVVLTHLRAHGMVEFEDSEKAEQLASICQRLHDSAANYLRKLPEREYRSEGIDFKRFEMPAVSWNHYGALTSAEWLQVQEFGWGLVADAFELQVSRRHGRDRRTGISQRDRIDAGEVVNLLHVSYEVNDRRNEDRREESVVLV